MNTCPLKKNTCLDCPHYNQNLNIHNGNTRRRRRKKMGSVKNEKKRREEEDSGEVLGVKKTSAFKNKIPLGIDRAKKKKKNQENPLTITTVSSSSTCLPASEQLTFFLDRLQSATGIKVSSLELDPIKDTSVLKLSPELDHNAESLSNHLKASFGKSWKQSLYQGHLSDGKLHPGSPAVLVISISALRSLELLRGLRPLTQECRAAKLFAKHMKVEDQVSMLKSRVNIASGTPSRIKKLIDIDALGLSRLSVILMDMHTDAKGYSLFTLPQVSDEFWDLYKTHFHHRVVQGDLRICLYGPITCRSKRKSAGTKVPVTNEA